MKRKRNFARLDSCWLKLNALALTSMIGWAMTSPAGAAVIVGLGVDDNSGSANLSGNITPWANLGIDGTSTTVTQTLSDIVDGVNFDYDVTITSTGGNLTTDGMLGDADGGSATRFENGDQFTISVSNIVESHPSLDVSFDFFRRIAYGNANPANSEGFTTAAGNSYLRTTTGAFSGGDFQVLSGQVDTIADTLTLTAVTGDNLRLRFATMRFSTATNGLAALPEPSSTALLLIGGLLVYQCRRRCGNGLDD